mmetsp:Transcript_24209/g.60615  ORF Transcript_24209/g.60615 Transcript_24209/m.60615 type:complete len:202 (+) Transcript_24209:2037-2642(+)
MGFPGAMARSNRNNRPSRGWAVTEEMAPAAKCTPPGADSSLNSDTSFRLGREYRHDSPPEPAHSPTSTTDVITRQHAAWHWGGGCVQMDCSWPRTPSMSLAHSSDWVAMYSKFPGGKARRSNSNTRYVPGAHAGNFESSLVMSGQLTVTSETGYPLRRVPCRIVDQVVNDLPVISGKYDECDMSGLVKRPMVPPAASTRCR